MCAVENTQKFNIFFQNVRGLKTKSISLEQGLMKNVCNADILCLNETWFDEDICNSSFTKEDFEVYRIDRKFHEVDVNRGGGVLIAIKQHIRTSCLDLSSIAKINPKIDIVGCKIHLNNTKCLYLVTVYIPSNVLTNDFDEFVNAFITYHANTPNNENFVLLGDFNAPGFLDGSKSGRSKSLEKLITVIGMPQTNQVHNVNDNMLDFVFTKLQCNVLPWQSLVRMDKHHPPLLLEISTQLNQVCVALDGDRSDKENDRVDCSDANYFDLDRLTALAVFYFDEMEDE